MGDAAEDAERRAEREHEEEVIDGDAVEVGEESEEIRSAELVIREERETMPAPASVLPSPKEWEATLAVATQIASTPFVPESYRGRPESVVAAILTGREMGIGPMQSLRQIHMIEGRPAFAADLMMAKMRAGGVVILDSKVTDEGAWITARRKDTGEQTTVEWTLADAEKAKLLGKKNWQTYRSDMFWARAVGRLARRLGSDLLGGLVYSKEEMEDWDDAGYGGAPGYEATTERAFDPERDLLEGAISGADAPRLIGQALNELDPRVDWRTLISNVTTEKYSTDDWRTLSGSILSDFWRRMSNATCWMQNVAPPGSMPPITEEQIMAGFAYAFSGMVVEVPFHEPAPLTAEQGKEADKVPDDIPFGGDK